jgi:hypothetical protein
LQGRNLGNVDSSFEDTLRNDWTLLLTDLSRHDVCHHGLVLLNASVAGIALARLLLKLTIHHVLRFASGEESILLRV